MNKKNKYLPIGARVKVVNPMVFLRCGYAMTIRGVLEEKHAEILAKVYKMCMAGGLNHNNHRVIGALSNAVASDIIKKEGFGGKERKVYERADEYLQDKTAILIGKRMVRTGTYSPGYGGQSFEGEYDYSPAYLSGLQSYCVYKLEFETFPAFYEILSTHCEPCPKES